MHGMRGMFRKLCSLCKRIYYTENGHKCMTDKDRENKWRYCDETHTLLNPYCYLQTIGTIIIKS